MVTITNTNLRANLYETVYDLLTAASLLSGAVTVTASYHDGDGAFPQVVVSPANIMKDNPSYDRSNLTNNIQIMLDIWTKKNKEIDQITDEIDTLSALKKISGVMFIGWEEARAYNSPNNNKLHLKTITLTYKRR